MSKVIYKYENKVVIKRNRSEVLDLFLDYERFHEWQPTLTKVVLKEGKFKEAGHLVFLFYEGEDGTITVMNESIENISLPHKVINTYQVGTVFNRQYNYFESYGADTMWVVETEFHFEEEPPANEMAFQRTTRKALTRFKRFVESN